MKRITGRLAEDKGKYYAVINPADSGRQAEDKVAHAES